MAQEGESVEAESVGEEVDIVREAVEAQALGVDALAATLAPRVDVEQPELVPEGVEPGRKMRVVEPRPAVEDYER